VTSKRLYIHPKAVVETDQIGPHTRIWAFTHVMSGTSIGANCNIGEHCFIESGTTIGSDVTVKNGNMIWEGVTLQNGVFIGPHVTFTNDLYPRSRQLRQVRKRYSNKQWLLSTVIMEGATVGAGAVLLAGIAVGEFAMIGAGAVVTRNVPAYALVIGNPAHIRGWVCQCGQPLTFRQNDTTCSGCGQCFVKDGHGVKIVPSALYTSQGPNPGLNGLLY